MFEETPASKRSLSLRSKLYGIGVNNAPYITGKKVSGKWVKCPFYSVWSGMLRRCYSEEYQIRYPSYKGCSVELPWLTFMNFKSWMRHQNWQNKELDKDLLIHKNKLYSENTCLFVSQELNKVLLSNKHIKGKHPTGIYYSKQYDKFRVSCGIKSKQTHIGYFETLKKAKKAYKKAKSKEILRLLKLEANPKLQKLHFKG